ncbi:MAG: hypothetical protein ACKVY0_16120 [Prosthecobacter sp.]|uniref:hypothetical protein n=1 Tax=Prosthecobacter sp. TaxID=1965333 RepID=UPI003900042A
MMKQLLLASLLLLAPCLHGAHYFVTKQGSDSNSGTSRAAAKASIQKAVDVLQPGDTLTIGPGEYHEAIKRADLGSLDKETIIRAEIPGTVLLRGDVPAPAFRPLAGHRFVYEADFDFKGDVPVVNEIDTLTILKRMPNSSELEFIPGTFSHDPAAGKIYVSSSDYKPETEHRYSVSVIPMTGVQLLRPRRVVIEGIAVTGFSAMGLVHYREETAGGVWGIFIVHGKDCVIRDCRAYLNAWGIGMQSGPPGSGDNVIERCVAWANKSAFANGDMGGITVFAARRDVIRDSTAFLNGMYGINIYGTGGAAPNYKDDGGNEPKNRSLLANNLAWGNETADLKIKTGYEYHHLVRGSLGAGLCSMTHVEQCLMGRVVGGKNDTRINNVLLSEHAELDLNQEFADPAHHDYHLQATSKFRRTDSGPFAYAPNIFYVSTTGDDKADGLAMTSAWKTLARAVINLRAGDTLYLEPGEYGADVEVHAAGTQAAPISLRGRGTGDVVLKGELRVSDSRYVNFERLRLRDCIRVDKSTNVCIEQCELTAASIHGVAGCNVSHCHFTADLSLIECSHIELRGNLFSGIVRMDHAATLSYSNYNGYRSANTAWEVGGTRQTLAEVQTRHDQQSQALASSTSISAGGPFGTPIGPYQHGPRRKEMRMVVAPVVHSVSATTANIEWMTSQPATCQLAWGETPACEHVLSFNVNCFGTYSLTGLKPNQRYHFRIKQIATPGDMLPKTDPQSVELNDTPIAFTTSAQNAAPVTYFVANDGDDTRTGLDRQQAWKTIRKAAAKVNVGDTVLIAGGKYFERVRLRATGEAGRPITFRCMPGERVEMNGNDMALNTAFVAGGKSYLKFDGLYFAGFNLFPNDSWNLTNCGEFHLYMGRDIEITRCFSEGRGGYSAVPVSAHFVENLTLQNCVNTFKFGGMYSWRCPNLRIVNCVTVAPMFQAFVHRNEKKQMATMENCIFTDMLEKKAKLNIGLLCCDGEIESFFHRNNCYFLRDCIPLEQRALDGSKPVGQLTEHVFDPLFADPQFAGDPGVKGNPADKSGHGPDRMMDATFKADFDAFFTTNPELIKRGIGLQPEAFKDFHFNQPAAGTRP